MHSKQTNRIYTYLEEGSRGYGQSEAWYGRIKCKRKNDDLLRYLHHAGNADEHTLQDTKQSAKLLNVSSDKLTEAGSQLIEITISFSIEGYLSPVIDRGTKYDVPQYHQGVPLTDSRPSSVAKLTLSYLEGIINDAKSYIR